MRPLMVQGTSSGAGKTVLVAALCRIFSDRGLSVVPFKSQNMSSFAYSGPGFEISRAQAVQALAAGCDITPDLNPILLKPAGNHTSTVYLDGKRLKRMHAKEYYEKFVNRDGIRHAADSLKRLQKRYDLVIMEGAGSPAEINLQRYDIANMRMAKIADASVLLVSDTDRGGSFASMAGTISLIEKKYQGFVRGLVFNKFRGDRSVLEPGFSKIRKITGVPVLGTIPMMRVRLPEEDSLGASPKRLEWSKKNVSAIKREIGRIARIVEANLDMRSVERMTK